MTVQASAGDPRPQEGTPAAMPDMGKLDLGRSARRLRVQTLVRLRWLAVAGQTGALFVVHLLLAFPLPFVWCLLVIAASGALNIFLRLGFHNSHRFDDRPAQVLLAYDVLQLSVLLFLTGGLENPFSMLFLAPVMISAASLSPSRTLVLGVFTGLSATILVWFHLPLPWMPGQELQLPFPFTLGIWVAIISGTAFTGVYASRVAEESRQLSDALAATELVLAREQHLSQLDGLAAAAAHELGTPLATITLVVRELIQRAQSPSLEMNRAQLDDDFALLDSELKRCRAILSKLSSLSSDSSPFTFVSLAHLLEDVIEPLRNFGVPVTVSSRGELPEPVCLRNPGILYGLGNLVENATDFARGQVHVDMAWTDARVSVTVQDDGPGFQADILAKLGEPYVTTRAPDRRAKSEEGSGLGLGLFIAKTLLERSGADLLMRNATAPQTGAILTVIWPRAVFERNSDRDARRGETISLSAALGRLP